MYHPTAVATSTNGPEEYEYLELRNISAGDPVDLTGVRFEAGVEFADDPEDFVFLHPEARALILRRSEDIDDLAEGEGLVRSEQERLDDVASALRERSLFHQAAAPSTL